MSAIDAFISQINSVVWGPVMLVLLFGTGIYLMVGMRFMPWRRIGPAFKLAFSSRKGTGDGDITPFQALTTALSATIGTGNIAGVATAIAIGGPGAVFWMWLTALIGMATKYSEAVLAVKYRERDEDGRYVGGPMYYIRNGLGKSWAWLGGAFAVFAAVAGFGIGNAVQTGEVANAVSTMTGSVWLGANAWAIGLVVSLLVFSVIIGGIKRIAFVAERLVPLMAVLYIAAALIIVLVNAASVPEAFALIFTDAFTGTAAAGGFVGSAVMLAIQMGVARGVFSNEAGLGSAPIAHAAAKTDDPVRQGTIAMLGTFIDTIIVCTLTALVILTATIDRDVTLIAETTGAPAQELEYTCPSDSQRLAIEAAGPGSSTVTVDGTSYALTTEPVTRTWKACYSGAALSLESFNANVPGGGLIVTVGLLIFAFTTILGWSYYGERAAEFLFGTKIILPFRILWSAMPFISTLIALDLVWKISDTMNAMMAIPNLIGLLLLSGTVFALTKAADLKAKAGGADGDATGEREA